MRIRKISLAATAATFMLVLSASVASAADTSGTAEEVFSDSSIAQMSPETKPGEVASRAIAGNPYGCEGYTLRVHPSGGMSSVHGGIRDCRNAPSYRVTGAEIMKAGWFGMWHRSAFYSAEDRNRMTKLDTNTKAVCGNTSQQTYRGNGYHRVTINGTDFTARTSSDIETRFGCDS